MNINKNLTVTNYNKGGSTSRIKYIVVHYTANNGDTAKGNTTYFKTVYRGASAHYFVDENSIWQCVDDKDIAWHCNTTGKYYHKHCRNDNSIGVELCSRKNGEYYFLENTMKRAAELIRYLMQLYNVPIENVIRHYDVTHKICPAPFIDQGEWEKFKNRLTTTEADEMVDTVKMTINGKAYNISRILKDDKNYICLADLAKAGFTVGYNSKTKETSLTNAVSKIKASVDGEERSLEAVNINGYNYCKLRDTAEAVGNFSADYEDNKIIITTD